MIMFILGTSMPIYIRLEYHCSATLLHYVFTDVSLSVYLNAGFCKEY